MNEEKKNMDNEVIRSIAWPEPRTPKGWMTQAELETAIAEAEMHCYMVTKTKALFNMSAKKAAAMLWEKIS